MLDASGKIVLGGGIAVEETGYQFMLARLEGGGVVVTPGPTATPDPAITNFVSNGGFEDPDFSDWKIKYMPPGKIKKCNKPGKTPVSYGGVCVFNFKGYALYSQIRQTARVDTVNFDPDDQLEFSAAFQSPKGSVIAGAQLKLVYKDGGKAKVEKYLPLSASYSVLRQKIFVGNNDVKKVKILIFSLSDRVMYIDEVKLLRLTSTPDLIGLPLPLPANP